ncbi:MAG TPA: RHS repeat-associated core domain-containing protein, partial [Patescibacteria group bacterium]
NSYLINTVLNNFIAAFAGTPIVSTVHSATASALQGSTSTYNGIYNWVTTGVPNPGISTVPRAYINWILFNEQFVPIASNCGYDGVSTTADAVKSHSSAVSILTSGYLYVYCSNESNIDVFFDNLQLIHTRGPLLETTDYYPFGLTMAGISDKALKTNYAQNKYRYNGKEQQNQEFSDGSGLELYDYGKRMYDNQIGRWEVLDPNAHILPQHSPYEFCINNPILFVDPDGRFPYPIFIRSFAPMKTFGGGFSGDNRGWSTSASATSRMQQTFTIDPSKKTVTGLNTWSDPSHHPVFGDGIATDRADVKAGFTSHGSDKVGVVTSQMAANLPLIPSADIDIHSTLRLTENTDKGVLNVQFSMDGDRFPAAEAFIGDTKGQRVFIGVSGYDGNPYTSLPGNNDRPMMYANFDVKINEKGEFTAVVSAGKTYTIDQWNKMVSSAPLEYQKSGAKGTGSTSNNNEGSGMTWSQAGALINSWLQQNPNIVITSQ